MLKLFFCLGLGTVVWIVLASAFIETYLSRRRASRPEDWTEQWQQVREVLS